VGIEFVKEQMKKDPAFVRNFQNDIIRNKVFDYLCSRNTVIENEISADEFERSKKQEPNQEVEGGSADEGR
jgi:hypothetical protein